MSRLGRTALPIVALLVFVTVVGLTIRAAVQAETLGYDFLAYHQAAVRLLNGQPLYDMSFATTGGFGLFYYPPTFAPLILPFGLLSATTAVWVWTAILIGSFAVGTAILPVTRTVRWWIVLLAGLSWPFAYAVKLGQVGPILFLLFAIGWRWLDDPIRVGASAALGTAIKLQPAIIFVWAILTRRWLAVAVGAAVLGVLAVAATLIAGASAWSDFVTLVRQVGDPITTPHNFTPGTIAYQLGVPAEVASLIQLASTILVLGAVVASTQWATAEASYLVAVIASQLLSPVLWDHYAMLLLLPVAYLCAAGRWWALLIPLVTATPLVGITPPIAYPLCFFIALGATLGVGIRARCGGGGVMSSARRTLDPGFMVGVALVAASAVIYWFAGRGFEAGRGDLFYLADAFLHGRTWLTFQPGPFDVIIIDGRFYVPFAPFPAIALIPVVAVLGATGADQVESGINAILAAGGVGVCWMLLGRIGVRRLVDRLALTILFGFSTQILWVTTRGGVWHTGHLIATILTFACLIELWGRQRAWLIGVFAGAAFLTRAPLAFAIPFYALMLDSTPALPVADVVGGYIGSVARSVRWRRWAALALGVLPAIVVFFAYNQVRFGSPWESGYGLATLPEFLERQRALGLFALAHLPMNVDLFLLHLPKPISEFPFFKPDGLGLSVLITSPGLLFASQADWRRPRAWWLLGAAILVLIPTLLYYGGGWLQYGYRYFLDSVPFVIALCGLAAVRHGRVGFGWLALIAFGTVVMGFGVYWADKI